MGASKCSTFPCEEYQIFGWMTNFLFCTVNGFSAAISIVIVTVGDAKAHCTYCRDLGAFLTHFFICFLLFHLTSAHLFCANHGSEMVCLAMRTQTVYQITAKGVSSVLIVSAQILSSSKNYIY